MQRTAFPAAYAGARSWRSHFVQPTTTLFDASGVGDDLAAVELGRGVGGAAAFATCGTVNDAPQGHFELCPAKLGLTNSVRWQLVQLYRIIALTNVERGVDLLRHCL